MTIKLIHPARFTVKVWDKLLDGTTSLAQFERKMKQHCADGLEHLTEEEKNKVALKFLGDVFEVFTEMLLKTHAFDRRIGIADYQPLDVLAGDEDLGVDGYGIGFNMRPATVQVKFVGNPTMMLTANKHRLVNFKNTSHEGYNVAFGDTENMLIVTNAAGLHHFTEGKMLNGKVRCINGEALGIFVNNNLPFWNAFRASTLPV